MRSAMNKGSWNANEIGGTAKGGANPVVTCDKSDRVDSLQCLVRGPGGRCEELACDQRD